MISPLLQGIISLNSITRAFFGRCKTLAMGSAEYQDLMRALQGPRIDLIREVPCKAVSNFGTLLAAAGAGDPEDLKDTPVHLAISAHRRCLLRLDPPKKHTWKRNLSVQAQNLNGALHCHRFLLSDDDVRELYAEHERCKSATVFESLYITPTIHVLNRIRRRRDADSSASVRVEETGGKCHISSSDQ